MGARPVDPAVSAYLRAIGKKGGQVSGARRTLNLTAAQRSDIAYRAACARWGRRKSKSLTPNT